MYLQRIPNKFIFLMMVFVFSSCGINSLDIKSVNLVEGTWHTRPIEKVDQNQIVSSPFSWGQGRIIPNVTLTVDLTAKKIYLPGLFLLDILDAKKTAKDQITLEVFFRPGNFKLKYIFNFLTETTFWIQCEGEQQIIQQQGKENIYYNFSGPKK